MIGNPFMRSLTELQGKCKARGSFLTSYTNLCEDRRSPIRFSNIVDEVASVLLMKAMCIAIYGLRQVAYDNNESILFSRDVEIVNRTYWHLLTSRIPITLESVGRSYGSKPFLETSSSGMSHGDGRSGYNLWQIRAKTIKTSSETWKSSKNRFYYKFIAVMEFGDDREPSLELAHKVFEFYKNGNPTTYISSYSPDCKTSSTTLPTNVDTTPGKLVNNEPDKTKPQALLVTEIDSLTVALTVIVILMVAGGASMVTLLWRKGKTILGFFIL